MFFQKRVNSIFKKQYHGVFSNAMFCNGYFVRKEYPYAILVDKVAK